MRLIICFLMAVALNAQAADTLKGKVVFKGNVALNQIVAASSLASFSDDFTRANSDTLGAGTWTEIAGDVDILSNEANAPQTFDNTDRAAAYTGTACTTANQYVKVTFTANSGANTRPGVVFRYTSGAAAVYEVRFDDANEQVQWIGLATPGGSETAIQNQNATAFAFPLTVGVTCSGTGNSTVINVWISPTGNAPDAGGATWGSASPTYSLTTDPGSPINTGSYVGIGGIGSGGALAWDNFFGGDIP